MSDIDGSFHLSQAASGTPERIEQDVASPLLDPFGLQQGWQQRRRDGGKNGSKDGESRHVTDN
ncbi:MAG: hypothetical protein J6Y90_05565 [Lachnospiraceae bacterium]|nr:hypothetical protein [Lachnospiraceae bacterium]